MNHQDPLYQEIRQLVEQRHVRVCERLELLARLLADADTVKQKRAELLQAVRDAAASVRSALP